MLSRSNSTAGDRLRRAKSTSSTHTSSSGHARTSTSTDPFVTRRQAEAAAVEAYQRAREFEEPAALTSRPVPPKLQRRRSQAGGKTEGSHFEDARLGRRRSAVRKETSSCTKPPIAAREPQHIVVDDGDSEEIVVTRTRSVIPPQPGNRQNQIACYSLPATRHPRKSQSGYTDGSPLPRNNPAVKQQRSSLQGYLPQDTKDIECNDTLAHLSGSGSRVDGTASIVLTPNHVTRTTQTDPEAGALARDKCFQDFHHGRLRERASSIFAAFHKRPSTSLEKSSMNSYDTVLPPYNFAEEGAPPQPLSLATDTRPAIVVDPQPKKRNFSSSFKGRFLKVFRKSSRAPSGLPAQHVEAKHCHYSVDPALLTDPAGFQDEYDPFIVRGASKSIEAPVLAVDAVGVVSGHVDNHSVAKSRISSWTASTAAGTWSTRNAADEDEDNASELSKLKSSDSMSTLRKASSFFGRPIKKIVQRPSKADLKCSEESEGLYSALQERINPGVATTDLTDFKIILEPSRGGLASLPSQQQNSSNPSSKSRRITIRSVNSDFSEQKVGMLSPVTEGRSPEAVRAQYSREDEGSEPTPRSQLQRRPAIRAPTPSKEQIAQRVERSQNRWQSTLDDMSPPAPLSRRAMAMSENPYTLQSLTRAVNDETENSDLPCHARVGEPPSAVRADALSPSIYSSGTRETTPRPESPAVQSENMVTITSREVRSYSISPPKRQHCAQHTSHGSQDWRRWLSNEMNSWGDSPVPDDFSIPQSAVGEWLPKDKAETDDQPESLHGLQDSVSTGKIESDLMEPSLARKRQSFMNERYPMVASRRNSGMKDIEASLEALKRPDSHISLREKGLPNTQRPVSREYGHRSHSSQQQDGLQLHTSRKIADESITPGNPLIASDRDEQSVPQADELTEQRHGISKTAHKPRSAFELRANYKTHTTQRSRPIEVRRRSVKKADFDILADKTIQNISAGPYASQAQQRAIANQENTPPPESSGLPALSSSEWLAAGPNKKREGRCVSSRDRGGANHSPSCGGNGDGGGSPGQRMVTNWLDDRKRSKENSPAFV